MFGQIVLISSVELLLLPLLWTLIAVFNPTFPISVADIKASK